MTTEQVLKNHLRRLQSENTELRSIIAEERLLRQRAYAWHQKRLAKRFTWFFDAFLMTKGFKTKDAA